MTMKKLAMALPQPKRPLGRPKKILDHRKLESIVDVLPESPVELLETLLIFDARCLDKETRQELIRILPQLVHILMRKVAVHQIRGHVYDQVTHMLLPTGPVL
jgi:hypothetical protein